MHTIHKIFSKYNLTLQLTEHIDSADAVENQFYLHPPSTDAHTQHT